MGGARNKYVRDEKVCVEFWCENLMKNNNLGDLGVDGRIILTLWLLMSYIYGAPSKARNANVVYIWTYVWQR